MTMSVVSVILIGQARPPQMTKGNTMSKIVLVAGSDGERGQDGKKKVYEIIVEDNFVTLMWGKAEEARRQSKRTWFSNHSYAQMFANEKKWEKISRGYSVAYTA